MRYLLLLLFLPVLVLKSQKSFVSVSTGDLTRLDSNWRFIPQDKPEFKEPAYDDSRWDTVQTVLTEEEQKKIKFEGIGWFRLHIRLDSAMDSIPLSLFMTQEGASELYIDGKKINEFGTIGTSEKDQQRYSPENEIIFFHPRFDKEMVIAIRYSNFSYKHSFDRIGNLQAGFSLYLDNASSRAASIYAVGVGASVFGVGLFAFFATLALVHFLLWLFYRAKRSNLYYTIFSMIIGYFFLHIFLTSTIDNPGTSDHLNLFVIIVIPFFFNSLLVLLYSLFYEKFPKQIWFFLATALLCSIGLVLRWNVTFFLLLFLVISSMVEVLRVIFIAVRKKKKGSALIGTGFGFFALFLVTVVGIIILNGGLSLQDGSGAEIVLLVLFALSIISIPVSMSVFLAWDFAATNKTLKKKLDEVEELSSKNLEQEKEKQKILETQKETLEIQVLERTHEINEQKKEIEEKNKDITDSINYAQRIQQAILPTKEDRLKLFPDSFVLFRPRDIVSGDFFWLEEVEGKKIVICADCTGHGVPGSLMSMIGSNLLHQIIVEREITSPEKILNNLHREVKKALKQQSGSESNDGMDMSVCVLDQENLYYSGAQRMLLIHNGTELKEIKADKNSIGGSYAEDELLFTLHQVKKSEIKSFYIFSDGFPDQFGGPKGKKFKFKQLAEILSENSSLPMKEQKDKLEKRFLDWKNVLEQVDDVCVIGVRI